MDQITKLTQEADRALDHRDDSKAIKLYREISNLLLDLADRERDPIMAHTMRDDSSVYATIANQIDQGLHLEVCYAA